MASRTPPVDPRLAAGTARPAAEHAEEAGVRPVVALPRSGLSGLALILLMLAVAAILFYVLESRRRSQSTPAVAARGPDSALTGSPPPPLYIPPEPVPVPVAVAPVPVRTVVASPPSASSRPPAPIVQSYIPQPAPRPTPPSYTPPPPIRVSNSPILVVDTTTAPPTPPQIQNVNDSASTTNALGGQSAGGRVRAGVFANKSATVPQGTLIPAVLETAFDSTRPGLARAIVSRDVRGFDGTKVLIPRGSRLTGEYRSDIQPGQRRALINWTRLMRPDGVTIALASPASDTLGRGGVSGHYNSHFWERFGGALLQSALDIGANLATRAATSSSSVVVALPGSTQTISPALFQSARIVPTITVPAGTGLSVFVARDLDFSGSEKAQ